MRYIKESINNTYTSCGINKDVLKTILAFDSFYGLRGIDFGFGNGEILEILKTMGADVIGLDSNFVIKFVICIF